ncbi:unnamed protein product [Phyllotreta striolata]|uniref:ABC-type xenobiotic transporter n=1 Tax=Phyllotreta striolata TaxID=444603 RepID=A0A9N9TKS7_PHYSR|nr:unnamed protein product [Phyllotreta striolata]
MGKSKKYSLNGEFIKAEEPPAPEKKSISFLQMFKYATKFDRLLIILGVFCSLAAGILQPFNTVLFGGLTGEAIKYGQSILNKSLQPNELHKVQDEFLDGVRYFALMDTILGIAMLILSYVSTVAFNFTAAKQSFKIRSSYLKSILNQDISWYDQNRTGDFASKISEDLYKFEDGIGEKVPICIQSVFFLLSAVVIALVKGWELALISLISIPITVVCFTIINLLTVRLAKNEVEAYGVSGSIAEEVFSLIRTVTAFNGQQKEIERYKKNLIVAKENNIRRSLLNGIGFGLLYLLLYSSYGLAFWYGVNLVLKERDEANPTYTPGNMVTVFFSIMSASISFGAVSPFLEVFAISKAAAFKIFSVIDNKPTINLSKGNGKKLEGFKGNIEFKNVKFNYPSRDVPVLQGINFKINPGETVALVGSSGCGKSTAIQLIQRFYDASSGEILIDGVRINELDLTWYRNRIGVVSQEPVLFGTTIMENIKYGCDGVTDENVIEAAKKANAHNFIKGLPKGYNTLVGERGTQLSGGQKQRIAIARALVRQPTVLLLDEATSALDNTSEAKVQAALDSASVECTTVIVAHRLSTIRGADKIFVLSQGVVVEEGTHDELMKLNGEYHKLVTTQVTDNEKSEAGKKISISSDKDVSENTEDLNDGIEEIDDFKTNSNTSLFEIMKLNSPEWLYILIASIGSTVVGFGLPAFAVIFGSILGTLSDADNSYVRSQTDYYCLCFVAAGAVCMVSVFLQNYLLGIAGEKMTERIRTQLFTAMVSQEMSFFDKKSNGVGALCAKLSSDAASIQGATGQRVGTILQSLATLGLAIGLSIYYQWKLGLVTAAFVPLIIFAIFVERRNTSGQNDIRDKSLQNSTKLAVEAIGNIRTVAGLVLEDKIAEKYINELLPHYKLSSKIIHWRGIVYGLSKGLIFFAYATTMYYGGFFVRDGLKYDKIFKIAQAQMMGVVSIANALAFSPNLTRGINSAKKIKSFLSRLPSIRDVPNSIVIKEFSGNVCYKNIEFSYPSRPNTKILNDLNINVLSGKTIALVGESGCGKSTIVQLIERFYDPSYGEVQLDDQNIKNIRLNSLRSHLGIVSQEPNLFNKTIAENIAYGDNSRIVPTDEIIRAAKNANIHNFIAGLPEGYETKLGEKAIQLSGGQKQRIAIARALISNPKVLLLDEATSALDTESEKVVQEALDQAKEGRTCIMIAHRLTTIQDADVIYVIKAGSVVESGTHKELLEKIGIYYKLYTQKT